MVDAPRPEHSPGPTPREHYIERLLSLLERTESSSRSLERAIFLAVTNDGRDDYRWNSWLGMRPKGRDPNPEDFAERFAPAYTRSLDAALTLAPEGWFVCIFNEDENHRWFCALHTNRHAKQVHSGLAFAAPKHTAPVALCIAALRARAAQ